MPCHGKGERAQIFHAIVHLHVRARMRSKEIGFCGGGCVDKSEDLQVGGERERSGVVPAVAVDLDGDLGLGQTLGRAGAGAGGHDGVAGVLVRRFGGGGSSFAGGGLRHVGLRC